MQGLRVSFLESRRRPNLIIIKYTGHVETELI